MAYSFNFDSTEPMSIEEYTDYISNNIDVYDQDALIDSAEALFRLSLCENVLDDVILAPINQLAGGVQSQNIYTDATFIISASEDQKFFIRANVWKKPRLLAGTYDFENKLYSYHQPHDHNFDFLTVGYHGPGYSTKIYQYEHATVVGEIGEPVDLEFLEHTHLPKGKVMMYRRSRDIHTQLPPEAMSISLNLMVPSKEQKYKQQLSFDLEKGCISSFVDGHSSYRVSVIDLAGELGDASVIDPLVAIAERNPCPRARAASVRSVLRLAPNERDYLASKCGDDPSVLVRRELAECLT